MPKAQTSRSPQTSRPVEKEGGESGDGSEADENYRKLMKAFYGTDEENGNPDLSRVEKEELEIIRIQLGKLDEKFATLSEKRAKAKGKEEERITREMAKISIAKHQLEERKDELELKETFSKVSAIIADGLEQGVIESVTIKRSDPDKPEDE